MSSTLSIIAAFDRNHLIGRDNSLPWRLPADLAFFKRTTMGKPVIMGRKTFESIGRPLPGRRNIIITRNPAFQAEGCEICASVEQALLRLEGHSEVMLIGGASLYQQMLARADNLYVTEIDEEFEGDAWFPDIPTDDWQEVWRENHSANDLNPHNYSFVKYCRK